MAIKDRGFASMKPETKKRVCSLGGKAAHAKVVAHEWTAEEAAAAGRKGGQARAARAQAKRLKATA